MPTYKVSGHLTRLFNSYRVEASSPEEAEKIVLGQIYADQLGSQFEHAEIDAVEEIED
jgi:hypothetical protein